MLADSCTPLLDSEVLLAHVLQKDRSYFRAWPEKPLSQKESQAFTSLLNKRQTGIPIAYLTGEREFWSRSFKVSPHVLIPRPDTELLIEIVLQKLYATPSLSILDLGTGSGAIAITLALELKQSQVTALDFSKNALDIAQQNAQHHCVNNIHFIESDWFNNTPQTVFDLIISNPPYIDHKDPHLKEGDVRFEPSSTLVAECNGLHDIKHITTKANEFLKPEGLLLFEHGYQQGDAVKNLLESSRFKNIEQFRDIQGHTRATLAMKP